MPNRSCDPVTGVTACLLPVTGTVKQINVDLKQRAELERFCSLSHPVALSSRTTSNHLSSGCGISLTVQISYYVEIEQMLLLCLWFLNANRPKNFDMSQPRLTHTTSKEKNEREKQDKSTIRGKPCLLDVNVLLCTAHLFYTSYALFNL